MKNPFTKKEIPKRTFAEALKLNFKKKEDKPSAPNETDRLKAEIESLRAENEALKAAMSEIAQPQTNSIAKIRAAAQTYIDEVSV